MWRNLTEEFLLFVLPFVVFGSYLILRRRNPLDAGHWRPHVFWLCLTGMLLAAASLVYTGLTAERHFGTFDPPHLENGRLVPGRFDDKARP
jgi:hypothetical protein